MSAFFLGMRFWLFIAVGALGLLSFAMAASTVVPGDQDLIRDRQNRLLEEQNRRLEELKDLPGKADNPLAITRPADTQCFPVTTIELQGADSISARERDRLLEPYVGQCLGVSQLDALLKDITHHYLDTGRVTSRGYLPEQDMSGGHLIVLVVEGKLERLKGAQGGNISDLELAMAFPGSVGQPLNLRSIEQLLDQLNRLPSNQARMEIAPGSRIGDSEVRVQNTPQKPWRTRLTRNNEGQKTTGEQQWALGLEWDSPTGLADQLVLRSGHDAISDHKNTSTHGMLSYNLPWGWWNLSYSHSQGRYRSMAQGEGHDFKLRGDNQSHQLQLDRVIHRDNVSKTSVYSGLSHLRTHNYVEGSKLPTSSNRLSEWQLGISHGRLIKSSFLNIDLGVQNGIGAFGAQRDNQHRLPQGTLSATPRYRKYTATASYLQPFTLFGESFAFTSLLTGQRSEDVLFAPQRISLGGLSSVRGFKEQQLAGDSGGYWRNDLRLTRAMTLGWLRPVIAEYGVGLGYDQGAIRQDRNNHDAHGRVSGTSAELFARGKHVSTSVTWSRSLKRPALLAERETPVYFRMDFFL